MFKLHIDKQYINHSNSAKRISPVSYSLSEKRENTNIEKRGGEYNTLKQNFANSLINFAQQKTGINLSDNINSVYTSTPLTYRDYLCTPLGSAYGYQKDYKNPMLSLFPVKTKFRNLFLTGQNINASGAIGVALTAATTCGEIIGSDYLTHKIATI